MGQIHIERRRHCSGAPRHVAAAAEVGADRIHCVLCEEPGGVGAVGPGRAANPRSAVVAQVCAQFFSRRQTVRRRLRDRVHAILQLRR